MDVPSNPPGLHAGSVQVINQCVQKSADRFRLDPALIWAIIKAESGGKPWATNKNRNGSHDLGIMQINSSAWGRFLSDRGITLYDIYADPCLNIHVGSFILRRYLDIHDGDWVKGIASYNRGAKNWRKGLKYARKIIYNWKKIREQIYRYEIRVSYGADERKAGRDEERAVSHQRRDERAQVLQKSAGAKGESGKAHH